MGPNLARPWGTSGREAKGRNRGGPRGDTLSTMTATTKARCLQCGGECVVEGEIYASAAMFLAPSRCPACGPTMARGGPGAAALRIAPNAVVEHHRGLGPVLAFRPTSPRT
jgi:hypothetical protein